MPISCLLEVAFLQIVDDRLPQEGVAQQEMLQFHLDSHGYTHIPMHVEIHIRLAETRTYEVSEKESKYMKFRNRKPE